MTPKSNLSKTRSSRGNRLFSWLARIFPSVGLFLLLTIVSVLIWLSAVGLPSFALRYVEDIAAQKGIALYIQSARLSYGSGLSLVIHESTLKLNDKEEEETFLHIGRTQLGLRLSPLFEGEFVPTLISIKRGQLSLPYKAECGTKLCIEDINLSATLNSQNIYKIATLSPLSLEGIQANLKADLPKAILDQTVSPKEPLQKRPSSLSQTIRQSIEEQGEELEEIAQFLAQQTWSTQQAPRIDISLNHINALRIACYAHFPSLRYKDLQFSTIDLSAAYSRELVTIHQLTLQAESPEAPNSKDTNIKIQGAYNLNTELLSFILESDMPLLPITKELLRPEDAQLFANISSRKNSSSLVRLQGDIRLQDDFDWKDAALIGYTQQRDLQLQHCVIDELELSFFIKNGNYAIDQASLRMGGNHFSAESYLKGGRGMLKMDSTLSCAQILKVLNSFQSDEAGKYSLPRGLSLPGQSMDLQAVATMISADYNKGSMALSQFLPSIDQLDITLHLPEIRYQKNQLLEPQLSLSVQKMQLFQPDNNKIAQSITAKLEAKNLHLEEGEMQPLAAENIQLNLDLSDISFEQEEESDIYIAEANATLNVGQVESPSWGTQNLHLELQDAKNIRPKAGFGKRLSSAIILAQTETSRYQEQDIQSVNFHAHFVTLNDIQARLNILFDKEKGEKLQLTIHKDNSPFIDIKPIKARLSPVIINELLPSELWEQHGISLQNQVLDLEGELKLEDKDGKWEFVSTQAKLHIPELVRQGTRVLATKDKQNTLDITLDFQAQYGEAKEILYKINEFVLKHKTGSISGWARGSSKGQLEVQGQSSIHLDALDEMIDNQIAHNIMRDFTMGDTSLFHLRNLHTIIDYSDGLDIVATSDVDIVDVSGLLGTYSNEVKKQADGPDIITEIKNKDPETKLQSKIIKGDAQLKVDIAYAPRNEEGKLVLEKSQIAINNITLHVDNRPWLQQEKISSGEIRSQFTVGQVFLDTKKGFVEIKNAQGRIYPDYTIGMFYYPLRSYIGFLKLAKPANIETHYCRFPLKKDSEFGMAGTIRMEEKETFHLDVVDKKIPVSRFNGFIHLKPKSIYLDQLNALCWEGVANGQLLLNLGEKTTGFDGYLRLDDANLTAITATFGKKQKRALCAGEIRLRSPSSKVEDFEAYGKLSITHGDLLQLQIFEPLADLINHLPEVNTFQDEILDEERERQSISFFQYLATKTKQYGAYGLQKISNGVRNIGTVFGQTASNLPGANYLFEYNLQNATADFTIRDGYFESSNLKAEGSNLSVNTRLRINLKTTYLHANLWPNLTSLLSLTLSPITSLSDKLIDISIEGPLDDLDWSLKLDGWGKELLKHNIIPTLNKDKNKKKP